MKQVPDAAVYTTLKNAVAAVVLLTARGAVRPAAPTSGGSSDRPASRSSPSASWAARSAFLLFFSGLAMASAPSAAFIQKTMFVWVAILAVPFLGERLGFVQIAALGVLAVGQALVLPPRGHRLGHR